MSTQLQKRPMTINGMLEAYKNQIAAALPKHITPDRMARLALTAIRRNARLGEADPISLFGAIIQSAQLGLEPGINAHLVPFKNNRRGGVIEVQMIPDYRGLVALARRSGEITRFKAEVVRENDEFDYEDGTQAHLRHKPAIHNRGEIIGAYAIAKFRDSEDTEFVFMPREDIDAIRARSKSADDGPWVTDYAAMAKKTVAKQLVKWLPVSVELQHAVQLDDLADVGKSQGNAAIIAGEYLTVDSDEEELPAETRTDAVKNKLKGAAKKGEQAHNAELLTAILNAISSSQTEEDLLEAEDLIRELEHPEDKAKCQQALEHKRKVMARSQPA
jgi:recombination protein RecT